MILAYYNEIDKSAAEWLRQLIRMNLITDGVVDERSIVDVQASDLKGFDRVHLFAGIGGWEYALKLAGWPEDRPVWTGSAPCQSFSIAGKQKGKDDERHLWPEMYRLIRECKPSTVFGEQVEGAIKHGWACDLQRDVEAENYAFGMVVLGAHSAGAPHIRQRLYWVANAEHEQQQGCVQGYSEKYSENGSGTAGELAGCGQVDGMEHSDMGRCSQNDRQSIRGRETADTGQTIGRGGRIDLDVNACTVSWMGNAEHNGHVTIEIGRGFSDGETESGVLQSERPSTEWDNPEWIYCRDNKYRPIKPSLKPLVDAA